MGRPTKKTDKKATKVADEVVAPEATDETKRGPGRPPGEKAIPEYIEALGTDHTIEKVALDRIDIDDDTYRFRVSLRIADLLESITNHGQQMPVILRVRDGAKKLQIISGFRRLTALTKIGWPSANAIVLTGVTDDQAFRISLLENQARSKYSDLDRAYAIMRYRKMGTEVGDIAQSIFRLSRKQVERLQSLTKLPQVLQDAISDGTHFKTTHALVLKQIVDKHKLVDFDYAAWVAFVEKDGTSIRNLKKAVIDEIEGDKEGEKRTVFAAGKDTKTGAMFLRFSPVRLELDKMSTEQKEALVVELRDALGLA